MKECYDCQKSLPEDSFYEDPYSNDGYTTSCRECQRKRSREYYKKTKSSLTPEQKAARKAAYNKWKENNPELYKQAMKKHNDKRVANRGRRKNLPQANTES